MLQAITQSPNYKWWVFFTIAIGTFLSVVDHGSVLVALPDIEAHFDTDLPTVQWVVVGYALAISVLLLPMGRLGDIVGRKKVYMAGFTIFVLAAALAGASQWTNLPTLITAKVCQGIGSAMIQGNGMATLISTFPNNERGKVLGTHLSVVGSGAIAGPALGGLLISVWGWQSVFFVNVPVGVISIAAAALVLQGGVDSPRSEGSKFDWVGALLSGAALLAFLMVVGNGEQIGWTSFMALAGAAASVVLLAVFIWWELRVPSPMLDLRLFRMKLVALGVAASFVSFLGTSSVRFMMPFYLQRVLEFSPREVGLLMIPPALGIMIVGPVSGRLSDRFGWRGLTMGGLAVSATASFALAVILTETSPVAFIIPMLLLMSIGTGLFNSPNNSSLLSAVERSSYGIVSALTQLVRNSANVASIALATAVVVVTMASKGVEPSLDAVSPAVANAFVTGLNWTFLLMGGLLVIGVVICYLRGERSPQASPAAGRERLSETAAN